jgi:hypothetical protein
MAMPRAPGVRGAGGAAGGPRNGGASARGSRACAPAGPAHAPPLGVSGALGGESGVWVKRRRRALRGAARERGPPIVALGGGRRGAGRGRRFHAEVLHF